MLHAHGFKNNVYFMCSALVWPHGWDIFSLSLANWLQLSPMDSCQDELSPSDPIESVCQHLQPPCSCKSFSSGITDHAPCAHFRFRWRSDSIASERRRSDSGRVYWTCVLSSPSRVKYNLNSKKKLSAILKHRGQNFVMVTSVIK